MEINLNMSHSTSIYIHDVWRVQFQWPSGPHPQTSGHSAGLLCVSAMSATRPKHAGIGPKLTRLPPAYAVIK